MGSYAREFIEVPIEKELKQSYLDYAMSVIAGRALPDSRDGLKPVHRRILYAMYESSNTHDKPFKKSARVVGDVIGKYHPHGDAAVYDSLVRMAQNFTMRYPIINGQGNFGSIDGDPPAAMRYTEVRMQRIAEYMLVDIEKNTVDMNPNYDGSLKEPSVLPTKIPNLLINGSAGIAVGVATNIPPHNLREIADAVKYVIKNPLCSPESLLKYVQGPDFPTGGIVVGKKAIKDAYLTGKGIITVRARAYVEKEKGERESIVITEIPYLLNKSKLIEKIARLAKDGKLRGIADLRDESDREGMRIVIEIKRGENSGLILKQLFKYTPLQTSFGIILLALHNNQPKLLNLKQAIQIFLEHRREVIKRKTRFDLNKAEQKAHILEGLKVAVDNLDRCIELIRGSKSPSEAKEKLMVEFKITEVQAKAILDMKLEKLTSLEIKGILEELKKTLNLIKELKSILASDEKVNDIITDEMKEIVEKFGDDRKTEIIEGEKDFSEEDLLPEEDMVVTFTRSGYIKRTPVTLFRSQRKGGTGVKGLETYAEDIVDSIFISNTKDYLMFFTNKGRVYWLRVHQIPQVGRLTKGIHIKNLVRLQEGESVTACLPVKKFDEESYVFFITANGAVKKTPLKDFSNPRSNGVNAISLDESNNVVDVLITDGARDIMLFTAKGKSIRFDEKSIRPMGKQARGVKGISLYENDFLVGGTVVDDNKHLLIISEKGYGKRVRFSSFRKQRRGGTGILSMKVNEKSGKVVKALCVGEKDEIIIINSSGKMIKTRVKEISLLGRGARGVYVMRLAKNEKIIDVAIYRNEQA